MQSQELADWVEEFAHYSAQRVTGVGAEQYDDGSGVQKFERLPLTDLFEWAEEELQDIVVYSAMLACRLRLLRRALEFNAERGGNFVD